MSTIAYVNTFDPSIDAQLDAMVTAMQSHHDSYFGPHWNTACKFLHVAFGKEVPAGVWPLQVAASADEQGALGYHAEQNGLPYGIIGAKDDLDSGNRLDVTCSHEGWEMAVNMHVNRTALFDTQIGGFRRGLMVVGAYEVSDAPESDQFSIDVGGGVKLSDWVYRWYFGGTVPASSTGVYSFSGNLKEGFSIDSRGGVHGLLVGGYLGVMQVRGLGGWTTVNARFTDAGRELEGMLQDLMPGEGPHVLMNSGNASQSVFRRQETHEIPAFSRRGRIMRAMGG